MPERVIRGDIAVVGAGVVGLGIAARFSREGREIVVLEADDQVGQETSSHNSGVIHSGIYYPPGSLKARLAVPGNKMLYGYARAQEIPHKRRGKLVVATTEETAKLTQLQANAEINGVPVQRLRDKEIQDLEPEVIASAGLCVPSTGSIDPAGLIRSLSRDVKRSGGDIMTSTPVRRGQIRDDGVLLEFGDGELALFNLVINSAGLNAQAVAHAIDEIPNDLIPLTEYAKGYYYELQGEQPFTHHVYPLPVPGGLGTHATVGLDGRVKFGPNVEWLKTPQNISPLDRPDYNFDERPERRDEFIAAIRQYYPGLDPAKLRVGDTGIRPKTGRGSEQDFIIQGAPELGTPHLINLFGIESPGLTSSLAIAETVFSMAQCRNLTAHQAAEMISRRN